MQRSQHVIGILGGTFDPFHNDHLALARFTLQQLHLDQLMLIPARNPPHKNRRNITPNRLRLEMVTQGIANEPKMCVNTIELDRPGKSYTIDTLRALKEKHPDTDYRLILGADMLPEFHLWKEVDAVITLGNPIIALRAGIYLTPATLPGLLHPSLYRHIPILTAAILNFPSSPISSSRIRELIGNGMNIKELVPDAVLACIVRNQLYHSSCPHSDMESPEEEAF